MIHTNRIVTVGEQESIIDRPIVLYRGDREVEIEFTLVGNEFMFSEEGNVIKSVNASHGQLVLNTPSGEHMFSELAECHEGKVVFVVTKEMIDEFIEMGFYSFQIRLYDSAEMKSRVTIPPVMNGFDIRNPIAAEDETNAVDQGTVDYARIFKDQSNEELPTFDWQDNYNKTEWVHHDVITENKLNKIEDALFSINANIKESDVRIFNDLDKVKKDADSYVKEHIAEVEADVAEFERNINTDVQKFKIDTNAIVNTYKNEVEGFSGEIESINTQLEHNGVNYGLTKAHKLIVEAYSNNEEVQYFMVGDSIRNSNGKYIYEIVSNKLTNLGVNCTLRGHSGLSLVHWSGKTVVTQGDELASDLIPFINGDGSNTIVDISLGLNDPYLTKEELLECLQMGIDIIKLSKPNTTFILTSPHKHGDIDAQKSHRDNLKYAYETMIKNNSDIGYINVFDNVFSSYTTEIGYKYMSDLLHPNELGQRAIANYIISKLIPTYLNEKICVLKGGLDKSSPNYLKIKGCSIEIELKIIKGDTPEKIILKYYKPFDSWYLCTENEGLSNISDSLLLVDKKQNIKHIEGATYNDNPIEFEGVIKITNSNLLNNIKDEGFQIEIIDCVVNEFSTIKTINEHFSDINVIYNHKYCFFNGHIDKNDPNYYKVDKVGFKINFKQTKGTPIENLRLYYYKDWDAWYLYSNNTLISNSINITQGIQIVTSVEDASVNGEEISFIAQIEIV